MTNDTFTPFLSISLLQLNSDPFREALSVMQMTWIIIQVIVLLTLLLLIIYMVNKFRGDVNANAHWYHHFPNLQMSSHEFYETIKNALTDTKMPGVTISRIKYAEGGVLSSSREYLRVSRKDLLFDICAAPFGYGFFISWWQADTAEFGKRIVRSIPLVGKLLERTIYPLTLYQIDTEEMFKNCIHQNLLATIDRVTAEKGIRGLTDLERKPIESKGKLL